MYRKFKGDLSFGYARFSSDADIKNGFAIALEPKFQVLDQLAIGARLETILLGKTYRSSSDDIDDFKIKAYQSLIATADYYFTKNYQLRPFAGGGGGIYSVISSSTGDNYYDDDDNGKRVFKIGGTIRAGVEIRHFRVGLEYNFIPNTTTTYYNNFGQLYNETSRNSYFAFKVGFCFSGGPLKK